jgi:protocatechuate 3,4-dioxygenase beta subunit
MEVPQMRKVAALALLVVVGAPSVLGDCQCIHTKKGETTHWGGNEMIVIVEKSSHKQLRGSVQMPNGQPADGALVEIFTHPEYLLSELPNAIRNRPEQQRVAACRTGVNGRFCFRGLAKGAYELRTSIDSGWDVTHIHVLVDPQKGVADNLKVVMHLGT